VRVAHVTDEVEALSRKHHFGAMDPAGMLLVDRLTVAGYLVLEITWSAMVDTAERVVAGVRKALTSRERLTR
jgi:hypothetical protein